MDLLVMPQWLLGAYWKTESGTGSVNLGRLNRPSSLLQKMLLHMENYFI